VLLRRNADVSARDGLGRTCLHFCVLSEWYLLLWDYEGPLGSATSHPIHRYSKGIILLIQNGADVHAQDHSGGSVSDYAYAGGPVRTNVQHLGGVWGDVWDSALAMCGYRISEFRRRHGGRRKACYKTVYTRQVFENVWEGYEHLCPYYHDQDDIEMDAADSEDEGSHAVDAEREH
jgi:hypothetical protein